MAAGGGRLVSFVTEKEAKEIKRRRQEQWEKVRKPGDPLEHPQEVAYDPRSLYERLKEQKDRKQEEYEEQFKFKNMIYKGLDDDEAGFLNLVAYQQANRDAELLQLEREEISTFREAVAQLNEIELEKSKSSHPTLVSPTRTSFTKPPSKSQLSLIAGAIKRKRSSSEASTENTPTSDESTTLSEKKPKTLDAKSSPPKATTTSKPMSDNSVPLLTDTDKSVNNEKSTGLVHLALYSSSDEDDNTNDEIL